MYQEEPNSELSFIRIEYFDTHRIKKVAKPVSESNGDGVVVVEKNEIPSLSKSKYFDYEPEDLDNRISSITGFEQISELEFKVSTLEQYQNMYACIGNLTELKKLSATFSGEWYLEILSEFSEQEEGEDENDEYNFALEFKKFVNLTHLEITFENLMFAQTLGDFAKVIQNFKKLQSLKITIPALFTFMDNTTYDRIVKSLNGLEELREYTIVVGSISKDHGYILTALANTIKNQPNLQKLNFQIDSQINEEDLVEIVECLSSSKNLTSLSLYIKSIQVKKSLSILLKPLYKHQKLEFVSINIKEQKNLSYIENMQKLASLHTIQVLVSNQKYMNILNLFTSVSSISKLKAIAIEFNRNIQLDQYSLSELSTQIGQFAHIEGLSLKFNSNNALYPKKMPVLFDSFEKLNNLSSLQLYFGKNNFIGNQNFARIGTIISNMPYLLNLKLSVLENTDIDLAGISSIYNGILSLRLIETLSFDIPNINSLLLLRLLNDFPQLNADNFSLKNLKFKLLRNEKNDITLMLLDLKQFHFQEDQSYETSFFEDFNTVQDLEVYLPKNKAAIIDICNSLKTFQTLQRLKVVFNDKISEQSSYEEEVRALGESLTCIKNITKMSLKMNFGGNISLESYQSLVNGICSQKDLEKLFYQIPVKQNNKEAAFKLFDSLKKFTKLEKIKISLGQLNQLKEVASFLDKGLSSLCKENKVQIEGNLNLNDKFAYESALTAQQFKSITAIKFKSTFQTYYELKLFLEKGAKFMTSLRHFEMINSQKVDQARISRQRSNMIRKIIRLVNFQII